MPEVTPVSPPTMAHQAGSPTGLVRLKVSPQQRKQIEAVINDGRARRLHRIAFAASVGASIPRGITLAPLPSSIAGIQISWRDLRYLRLKDRLVLVDPRTRRVVAVLDGDGIVVREARPSVQPVAYVNARSNPIQVGAAMAVPQNQTGPQAETNAEQERLRETLRRMASERHEYELARTAPDAAAAGAVTGMSAAASAYPSFTGLGPPGAAVAGGPGQGATELPKNLIPPPAPLPPPVIAAATPPAAISAANPPMTSQSAHVQAPDAPKAPLPRVEPWPPPVATRSVVHININAVRPDLKTVGAFAEALHARMTKAGQEIRYWGAPHGFAIVTRIEPIDERARPLIAARGARYAVASGQATIVDALMEVAEAFVSRPTNKARLFLFVVTDDGAVSYNQQAMSARIGDVWQNAGKMLLPEIDRAQAIGPQHMAAIFLYEFARRGHGEPKLIEQSSLSLDDHLKAAGIDLAGLFVPAK